VARRVEGAVQRMLTHPFPASRYFPSKLGKGSVA
jgi:hypothetical protein